MLIESNRHEIVAKSPEIAFKSTNAAETNENIKRSTEMFLCRWASTTQQQSLFCPVYDYFTCVFHYYDDFKSNFSMDYISSQTSSPLGLLAIMEIASTIEKLTINWKWHSNKSSLIDRMFFLYNTLHVKTNNCIQKARQK